MNMFHYFQKECGCSWTNKRILSRIHQISALRNQQNLHPQWRKSWNSWLRILHLISTATSNKYARKPQVSFGVSVICACLICVCYVLTSALRIIIEILRLRYFISLFLSPLFFPLALSLSSFPLWLFHCHLLLLSFSLCLSLSLPFLAKLFSFHHTPFRLAGVPDWTVAITASWTERNMPESIAARLRN